MNSQEYQQFFSRDDVMVVLTTSTAGLGHKRVTRALRQGLPETIQEEKLGANDFWMQILHRFTSRNFVFRYLFELIQNTPILERSFARFYRRRLRKHTKDIYQRMRELIQRRKPTPKVVLILATHFSLAHELAVVKRKLDREFKLKILLAVVVTDDSPQELWAVQGADYLFVPSELTKATLLEHFKIKKLKPIPEIVVKPYPISLSLAKKLDSDQLKEKEAQVKAKGSKPLKVMVPISGAAVQLHYLQAMIESLCQEKQAFVTVVSRESKTTAEFLTWAGNHPCINVVAKSDDRDVVKEYEEEFHRAIYSLEITKPSEQSFKALFSPRQLGGVIMLFSDPVGRQEDDNIAFLLRHGLLPNEKDATAIRELCLGKLDAIDEDLLKRARRWRGILLPIEGAEAGCLIKVLRKTGVLEAMMNFTDFEDSHELADDGVQQIWHYLATQSQKFLK
ncbi:MAG: hypothetical protein ABII10_01160 [Candidatus Paceibacterota bacterium]